MRMAGVLGAALLSGCAGFNLFELDDPGSGFRDPGMTVPAATQAVQPGRSTQAEVRAALGDPTVIPFDSGYEVWVYRVPTPGARERTEFVVLFDAAGIARKSRVRQPVPQR